MNVALWQNHVPVLTALSITVDDPRAAGDIIVELACEPSVIRPRLWVLQSVKENETRVLSDLDVALDGKILDALTESTRAVVTFTVRRCGLADDALGEKLGERNLDLRMLARNEWGGSGGIPDILAAFVEPNDPAIGKLLRLTSDQLRAAGKTDGLEGYQATSKARLWEQVEALWRAVASLDIRYVNPPASFEVVGQRIRPPREVLSEKLATCLDLAVLVASAIEAIGMRPVIVLIKDHAFSGVWLTRHDFGSSIV
ncbi:MAG: disulfide oxidoreductase, partial [Rhodopila sp.]